MEKYVLPSVGQIKNQKKTTRACDLDKIVKVNQVVLNKNHDILSFSSEKQAVLTNTVLSKTN
jgi:hypothetical protein